MVATLAANSQILSLRVPPIRPRWRSPARCCPLCSCGYGIVMNPIGPRMLVKDSQFLHVSSNTYRNPAVHNRIVHLPHTSTSRALRALFEDTARVAAALSSLTLGTPKQCQKAQRQRLFRLFPKKSTHHDTSRK